MSPGRFDEIKHHFGAAELLELARAEGLHHRGSGRRRAECPGCKNGDPRGISIGERGGVGVFCCHRDESHRGTAIDFIAFAHNIDARQAVDELEHRAGGSSPAPRRLAFTEPTYPPAHEVAEVWGLARALHAVPDVAAGWAARGIDVAEVENRDLARALPFGVRLPRWAWGAGTMWSEGSHRLVVPMFDASGRMVTLHARMARAPKGTPKGLSPSGFTLCGAVMADAAGRELLKTASPSIDLVIAEGVPDFLLWATRWKEATPAIISVIAGSWTEAVAARVPEGGRVLIATHHDEAGEKYADAIVRTLRGRCRLLRGRPEAA